MRSTVASRALHEKPGSIPRGWPSELDLTGGTPRVFD